MADFRKWFLAFAVAALLFGLCTSIKANTPPLHPFLGVAQSADLDANISLASREAATENSSSPSAISCDMLFPIIGNEFGIDPDVGRRDQKFYWEQQLD